MNISARTLTLVITLGFSSIGAALASEPIWDANTVNMRSEKLAAGVYAFYADDAAQINLKGGAAATSSGVIVGTKSALLIDTMINERLHDQVRALVEKHSDRPLAFAVNTSAHGDHAYGNMYLPENVVLIQHEHSRDFMRDHLEKDKAFMIQNFGADRGIEEIRARTGDILVPVLGSVRIDLGGRVVRIIDFGFAQTGGDLWVFDETSKVMWSGNPVIATQPALPWLLDGQLLASLKTLKKVADFLPADARIVPGHGVPMNKSDLNWHVRYLETLQHQVQEAIKRGLSLEETVAAVSLPEFAGYAIFDWIHKGVNVPAAYGELGGAPAKVQ